MVYLLNIKGFRRLVSRSGGGSKAREASAKIRLLLLGQRFRVVFRDLRIATMRGNVTSADGLP